MRRTLRRIRQSAGVNVLEPYRLTKEGQPFLRYEEDGMMIFASDDDIKFLSESSHVFGDGTFKIAPNGYVQQYTLHAYHEGITYPCVYALLPGKSEQVYSRMIEVIKNLVPNLDFNPVSIMTDFEKAAMNAFGTHFPNADISGCYFHLGQSAWRHLQAPPGTLARRYKEDTPFALRVRRFLALAFVPPNEVHHYMQLLMADEASRNDGILEFAEYFQQTYVGRWINDNTEIPGMFPYQIWNMYQRVKDGLPRTNNSLEGWHGAFAKTLPCHPLLSKLAAKYQTEQHKNLLRRQHQAAARQMETTRRKYRRLTAKLQSLIDKLDRGVLVNLPYLEQIARVMVIPTHR